MTIISAYGGKKLVIAENVKSFYLSGKLLYADEIRIGEFSTYKEAENALKLLARSLASIKETGQTDIVVG